jgi:hypothetical protein
VISAARTISPAADLRNGFGTAAWLGSAGEAHEQPEEIDRSTRRASADAEAIVAAFTARLRDAVELDAIRSDLLDAVHDAVQPANATVWIRR